MTRRFDIRGTTLVSIAAAIAVFFIATACAAVPSASGSVHVGAGTRSIKDPLLEELGGMAVGTVALRQEGGNGIVGELGLAYATGSADGVEALGTTSDVDAEFYELSAGLRKYVELGPIRPYIGAGVSRLWLDGQVSPQGGPSIDASASAWGAYVGGGADLILGPGMTAGLDVRYGWTDRMDVEGQGFDAESIQTVLSLGWSF